VIVRAEKSRKGGSLAQGNLGRYARYGNWLPFLREEQKSGYERVTYDGREAALPHRGGGGGR
jgi:hypothetical protein